MMILFRKFRIKRVLAQQEYLRDIIHRYQVVMRLLPPGLVLSDVHLNDFERYLDEYDALNEKLVYLGVAKREAKSILDSLATRC